MMDYSLSDWSWRSRNYGVVEALEGYPAAAADPRLQAALMQIKLMTAAIDGIMREKADAE